jgi:hypothetical protein
LARPDGRIGDVRIRRLALRDSHADDGDGGKAGEQACAFGDCTHDERSLKLEIDNCQRSLPAD